MGETQTAYAKSILVSKTFWFNVASTIAALSEMTEFTDVIPEAWQPKLLALVAIINIVLRKFSDRPVAMVAPGQVVPVEVKKLEATKQGTEDADKLPARLQSGEVPK